MNRRIVIVVGGFFLLVILVFSIFFLTNKSSGEATGSTGGSGQLPVGSLVLYGYETSANTGSKLPVGRFLSVDQQSMIESKLEEILFEEDPKREYRGEIVPGTVNVDYQTNVITFDIKIEEPSSTYTINFNTVTDEISILNEQGNPIPLD